MNVFPHLTLQNEAILLSLMVTVPCRRTGFFGYWTVDFGLYAWPNGGKHFAGMAE